jgi:hypothetical protein
MAVGKTSPTRVSEAAIRAHGEWCRAALKRGVVWFNTQNPLIPEAGTSGYGHSVRPAARIKCSARFFQTNNTCRDTKSGEPDVEGGEG